MVREKYPYVHGCKQRPFLWFEYNIVTPFLLLMNKSQTTAYELSKWLSHLDGEHFFHGLLGRFNYLNQNSFTQV